MAKVFELKLNTTRFAENLLGSLVCSTGFFIIEWLNLLGLISSIPYDIFVLCVWAGR